MKSGFVSLIGRTNVGKSTLINQLVSHKIAITSNKPQTTRNIIQGVYNDEDYQIVFIDTPGFHKPHNRLGKVLNKQAGSLVGNVDVVLFVIDASVPLGAGDQLVMTKLKSCPCPIILVLNKIDKISNEELLLKISEYKDLLDFAEIVPVSALKKDNIERLIAVIKNYLTDHAKYFDEQEYTTNSLSFMISELVREKLMNHMSEEIPHSITCFTSQIEEKTDLVNVTVEIIVDRDSLKKIIIGKSGHVLKTIGTEARMDMEELLNKKVYLELYVKTIKDWRDKERYLKELGFVEK